MNKTVVIITGIVVAGLLIGFYIYSHNKPETKSRGHHEPFFDKEDQRIYNILTREQNLTEDDTRLLELLNKQLIGTVRIFHIIRERKTVEGVIKQKLGIEKGDFRIIGWKVKRIDEQTSLVSYTYEKNGKILGWFFDVKSGGRIIRDVSLDQELMKKYNVVYKVAFTEEDEAEMMALKKKNYEYGKISGGEKRLEDFIKDRSGYQNLPPDEQKKYIELQRKQTEHEKRILMPKQD